MRSVMQYELWELTNENIELSAHEAASYTTYTSYLNI
jgi:hypothetical protein